MRNFLEWLGHRLLVAFQRREAPVVTLRGTLAAGESLFLVQGEIPNLKGQPAVHAWFGVRYEKGVFRETLDLDQLLAKTGLATAVHANPGTTPDLIPFQSLVPDVVARARAFLSDRRASFNACYGPALATHLENLKRLEGRQAEQLEIDLPEGSLNRREREKKEGRKRQIRAAFDEHVGWVRETMTVEDKPYLRIAALFVGEAR